MKIIFKFIKLLRLLYIYITIEDFEIIFLETNNSIKHQSVPRYILPS